MLSESPAKQPFSLNHQLAKVFVIYYFYARYPPLSNGIGHTDRCVFRLFLGSQAGKPKQQPLFNSCNLLPTAHPVSPTRSMPVWSLIWLNRMGKMAGRASFLNGR